MTLNEKTSLDNSDSALMLSYSAGDGEGFEVLYNRHKVSVYQFFYFGTDGDEILAGELYQDVWMTIVRGRKRYTKDIRFTDWLRHIAWARLYDHLRLHPTYHLESRQKPDVAEPVAGEELPSNVVPIGSTGFGVDFNAVSDAQLLQQLQSLSDDHREIVLLRFCFRMDFNEIAQFLDVARSSVNRLHREALVCLRQMQPEAC